MHRHNNTKRKRCVLALLLVLFLILAACSSDKTPEGVDVDLSVMSGAVVYGKVNDMVTNGSKYIGQVIRMEGTVSTIDVMEKNKKVDMLYSCIISDATKCCAQGIEFEMKDDAPFPAIGTDVIVQGTWTEYKLYGLSRYKLVDAVLINK